MGMSYLCSVNDVEGGSERKPSVRGRSLLDAVREKRSRPGRQSETGDHHEKRDVDHPVQLVAKKMVSNKKTHNYGKDFV